MMKNNRRFAFLIALLVLSIVIIGGTTYALFTKTIPVSKVFSIKTSTKYIGIYGSSKENIILDKDYNFTIENRGIESASYDLYLEDIDNTIGGSNITYTYIKNGVTKTGSLSDRIIDSANLNVGEILNITIHLSSSVSGDYKGRIVVETKKATEDVSGANAPVLNGDMIPVVYDEVNNNWIKADTNSLWYNYDNGEWANAVTIKDEGSRARYIEAASGSVIDISDINTMWVWIPRYSYTLKSDYGFKIDGASDVSLDTPGAFDIKFIDKNEIDSGTGTYTGEVPSNYYTPSSFCYGDTCDTSRSDEENIELMGLWVSKFELTGDISDITSVPNANSIRNQNVNSFYGAIQKGLNGDSGSKIYGFSNNYDVHMIKNTEWGLMAYLSQSKYGKYGNVSFAEVNKEIFNNNYYNSESKETISGCSSGSVSALISDSCTYTYDVAGNGTGASTTGNIYGIYDTVGGSNEVVMANYNKVLLDSGIENLPASKYYNLYTSDSGIKGDATNQDGTLGFYKDSQTFINDSLSWLTRGGGFNIKDEDAYVVGIFGFSNYNGDVNEEVGTRMVLVSWE